MERPDIPQLVLERLNQAVKSLGDYRFAVMEKQVFQDEDHMWHVPVHADRPLKERGRLYDLLNDVEDEIEKDTAQPVLIIPIAAPTQDSAKTGAK